MDDSRDILAALLRVQSEIRDIEKDELAYELEEQNRTQHSKITRSSYVDTEREAVDPLSGTSVAAGTDLVLTPTNGAQDVAWADFYKNAETPEFSDPKCANGTNCLGDNFCYSWYDCDPCSWCENFQCVERDPNRTCDEDWECPCPPTDDQYYKCEEGRCALTCKVNADCPETEVCGPDTFTCQPGCENDAQCVPGSSDATVDARSGTFCVEYECVTPCEPPKLCKGENDFTTCGPGEYCGEKIQRAATDPTFEQQALMYECVSGCAKDSQCEVQVYELDNGDRLERQPLCIDNDCVSACRNDGDCISEIGEICNSGKCENVGLICNSDQDCEEGQYCNENGRCASGCRDSGDCRQTCEKVQECVSQCGPEPTCTCTDFYTAELCGTTIADDWESYCQPDPACVSACPDDPDCVAANTRNLSCVDRQCKMLPPCPDGYAEVEGECIAKEPSKPETICEQTETCTEQDNGSVECVITEECREVPVYDSRFPGCDCADVCDNSGQCVPSICRFDSDCESCSYCADGICVPGCDEENECAAGQCCQTDGKCHEMCATNEDCPETETCLEGCCGIPCDPIIPCISSQSCPDGFYCGVENICETGCKRDEDCSYSEICVADGEGDKTCVTRCDLDEDCDDGFYCYEGSFCRLEIQTCGTDDDCPPLITDYGDVFQQICTNQVCEAGCRADSDCGTSMICYENSCEYVCSDDLECSSIGYGDECLSNPRAKAAAKDYYNRIRRVEGGTAAEFDRWEFLSRSSQTGFCVDVLTDSEGNRVGTQRACEGFEQCNLNGECERRACINDADCPTGNCMSDGLCGLCTQDEDCLDGMLCIFDTECDKNGKNCKTLSTGTCAYPCIPQEDCSVDTDCPKGTYCASDDYAGRGQTPRRFCAEGCRNQVFCDSTADCPALEGLNGAPASGRSCEGGLLCPEDEVCINGTCGYDINTCESGLCKYNGGDCAPGTACRDNTCLEICSDEDPCRLLGYECNGGLCVNVGIRCTGDEECPENLGECYQGICIEDLRCSSNDDCAGSELCKNGICETGDFCENNFDCQRTCTFDENGNNNCPRRESTKDPCVSSSDCSQSGEFCDDGECMSTLPECRGGYCYGDQDPQHCGDRNTCVAGTPCNSNGDCDFPDLCYEGACQFFQPCGPGQPACGANQYCDQGACVPDLRCSTNGDCLEGFFCNRSGKCQESSDSPRTPNVRGCPDECLQFCDSDFTCKPITCVIDDQCPCGPCDNGQCTLACEDNTDCPAGQVCGDDGRCTPCRSCAQDSDCGAGIECVEGCCDQLPSCRSDSDCETGYCFKGECVDCRRSPDCAASYGDDRLVCVENVCETPCYTGLSSGDCFEGLKAGDTCENCSDKCPIGYTCGPNGKVCGEYEVLNLTTNQPETRFIECQACIRTCESDVACSQMCDVASDCVQFEPSNQSCNPFDPDSEPCPSGEECVIDGTDATCRFPAPTCENGICFGEQIVQENICGDPVPGVPFRSCEYFDGRCNSDIDCDRVTALDGIRRTCTDSQCVEATTCIGNSDCELNEVCSDGVCIEGNCNSDVDCGSGYVCGITNKCVYACGETTEAFACSPPDGPYDDGVPCPTGYTCNDRTNLCTRDGYEGVGRYMPFCGSGTTCIAGGCIDCQGNAGKEGDPYNKDLDFDCRDDVCCAGKEPCDKSGNTEMRCQKGKCTEVFKAGYQQRWAGEEPYCPDDPDQGGDQPSEEQQDLCALKGECCGPRGFCEPCGCDENNPCEGDRQCCDTATGQCFDLNLHPLTRYGAPGKCSFGPIFCEVLGPEGEDDEERSTIDVTTLSSELYAGCEDTTDEDGNPSRRCWPGGPLSPSQIATILGQQCNPPEDKECECTQEIPEADECLQDSDCDGEMRCVSKTFNGDACCPVADEDGNDFVVRNICQGQRSDGQCETDDDCTECEYCDGYIPGTPDTQGRKGTCTEDCINRCPDGGELTEGGQRCLSCEEYYGPCVEGFVTEQVPAYIDDEGFLVDAVTTTACRVKTETNCCEGIGTLEQARRQRDGCIFRSVKVNGQIVIDQVNYCVDFDQDICAECTEDSHCLGSNSKCKNHVCITECGDEDSEGYDYVGDCTCCTGEGECKEAFESWSETREVTADDGLNDYQTRPCACTATGIDCGPWTESNSCYKWYKVDDGSGDAAKAERNRIELQYEDYLGRQKGFDEDAAEANEELSIAAAALTYQQKITEIECATSEACDSMVEEYDTARDSRDFWDNKLVSLNAEMVALDQQVLVQEDSVAYAEALVDANCPDTPACANATAALLAAQEGLRVLNEETIPAKQLEIDNATTEQELAQTAVDYWKDEVEEICGYQPTETNETFECRQAKKAEEPLQQAYDAAFTTAQDASLIAANNLEYVLELEAQLKETIYRPAEWVQQRTCGCCVDGQCRDDAECNYGTCYLCQKPNDKIYHVQLYTKVQPTPVCTGCTDLDGNPADGSPYCPDDATGPNRVRFVEDNECVKYRCEDGIATMQEPCDVYQNRWWDSCQGSILGCVVFGGGGEGGGTGQAGGDASIAKYWNGYAYEFDCPSAGVWAYNNKSESDEAGGSTDWVRLSRPEEEYVESKCAYPNPLGILGGNWIPTFVDLVKIHPCCAKADAVYECDPETPGCQTEFELFYERSSSSDLLQRLEYQIAALENFLEQIVDAKEQLEEIRKNKREEIVLLEEMLENLVKDGTVEDIQKAIEEYERLIAEAQEIVSGADGVLEELQKDYDEADEELQEVLDDRQEIIDEQTALTEQRDDLQFQYNTILINANSAKDEYTKKIGELARARVTQLQQQDLLVDQGCSCPFGTEINEEGEEVEVNICPEDAEGNEIPAENADTVFCFNRLQEYDALLVEIDDLISLTEALEIEYTDLFKQADDLKTGYTEEDGTKVDGIDDLQDDIDRLQRNIDGLSSTIRAKSIAVGDAQTALDEERQRQLTAQNDIVRYSQEIQRLEEQEEIYADGSEEAIADLEDAIAKADDVVGQIDELIGVVEEDEDKVEQAIADKKAEKERIEEELGTPEKPVGSSKPDQGKTIEEIEEEMAEVVEEDKKKAGDTWYPE